MGSLVARGGNIAKRYLNGPTAMWKGWYLGLGDIGFWMQGSDGQRDYYWSSRASGMYIKGGANYSCEVAQTKIEEFATTYFQLALGSLRIGVCARRLRSEHDDDLCVLLEPISSQAKTILLNQEYTTDEFFAAARKILPKAYQVKHIEYFE
jgi:hypothetical protein